MSAHVSCIASLFGASCLWLGFSIPLVLLVQPQLVVAFSWIVSLVDKEGPRGARAGKPTR